MRLHPILSALRRHKTGVFLIALQVALTLAIVSNAVFIIGQRIARMERPTGIVENGLIRISQQWLDAPKGAAAGVTEQLDAMQRTDLATLRALPGVQDVAASTSLPLAGTIWSGQLTRSPTPGGLSVHAAYYYGDAHLRATLGLPLLAGRDFTATEILHRTIHGTATAPVVIVDQPVADRLFPHGDALGKTIYRDGKPATIVGIVGPLQTPTLGKWGSGWSYDSVLEPVRLDAPFVSYAVQVQPGQEQAVMREARKALLAVDPMRWMPDTWGIRPFSWIRDRAYRGDRGMVLLMGTISLILLCVTAAGIVGLTSFWIGQRRKQIGVRRALGATRADILRHFQLENLFIVTLGAALGVVFAIGLNLWLMSHYEMAHLPELDVLAGVVALIALGQAAVFVPALRASRVPPVVATRSA